MSTIGLNVHLIPSTVASSADTAASFSTSAASQLLASASGTGRSSCSRGSHRVRRSMNAQRRTPRSLLSCLDVRHAHQVKNGTDLPVSASVIRSPGAPFGPSGAAISSWPNFSATVMRPIKELTSALIVC